MKIWELNLNFWIESLHKYVIQTSRQNTCEYIFPDLLVSCKDKDIWIISHLSSVFTEYCHTLTGLWWNLKSRFLCEAGGCTAVWWGSIASSVMSNIPSLPWSNLELKYMASKIFLSHFVTLLFSLWIKFVRKEVLKYHHHAVTCYSLSSVMRAYSLQNNFALMKCVSGRGQRSDTDSRFAQFA